ncbi:phosphatidate cytidylyltransferase [Adhaeretor mobilis]|uniref:Phosphatidate cytidylyltransferase n=1 Tax=Adhaeretor mobilis TaxID=1930276 RepID=A0A517MXD9_9BACT|nr:phosphatidate cytidylyltransferase [Adhaeretor mobilis]QDS99541.1 Phosphatidate cytidylyltransferase [Adhaeretor mobilis]
MIENWMILAIASVMLVIATGIGRWLRNQESLSLDLRTVEAYNARVQAWWAFAVLLAISFFYPKLTVALFGAISFWALREFVSLTPTSTGDHRALFWVFAFFTPMQFILVAYNNYGLYNVLIPVYAFLFIAARVAFSGDFSQFLERVAKVQSGLMLCVYCLSFAPALLFLRFPTSTTEAPLREDANAELLFFFITIALIADLMQFLWNRLYGKHIIAEKVDPVRTWEGLIGGAITTAIISTALAWAAPFPHWYQAPAMSLVIALMASAGTMTMSALKRDRGELATGTFVEGHGGVLNRIDSICFAAPVFFHLTRYFFAAT